MESLVNNGPVRPESEANLKQALALAESIIKHNDATVKEQSTKAREASQKVMTEVVADFMGILSTGFDVYDVMQDMAGGYNSYPGIIPPIYRQSQKRGELLPVYLDENSLRFIRDRQRKLCAENPYAICALENRVNYSVGDKGLLIKVTKIHADCPDSLATKVQKVLDLWQEANDLPEMEVDLMQQIDTDGEHFIRDFEQARGVILHRTVEPEHVRSPTGAAYGPHYSFGIQTKEYDIQDREGYWVVEKPIISPMPSFVPACEVTHFKLTRKTAKRGLPLFYSCELLLRYALDLLRGVVTTANLRARYAVIKKMTNNVVRDAAQKLTDSLTNVVITNPGNGQTVNAQQLPFGSIVTTGTNQEIEFPSGNLDTNVYELALQMVLRGVAARCNMPEWMLTADASNANYSSSFIAEAPSIRSFGRLQEYICRRVGTNKAKGKESLAWRQIDAAVRHGILPEDTRRWISLTCEGPSLIVRDKGSEAMTNRALFDMKLKAPQLMQQEMGVDTEKNFKLFKEWDEKCKKAGISSDPNNPAMNTPDDPALQQQQQMQMQQDQGQDIPGLPDQSSPGAGEDQGRPTQQEAVMEAEEDPPSTWELERLALVIKILAQYGSTGLNWLDHRLNEIKKQKESGSVQSLSFEESVIPLEEVHKDYTGLSKDSIGRTYYWVRGKRTSRIKFKQQTKTMHAGSSRGYGPYVPQHRISFPVTPPKKSSIPYVQGMGPGVVMGSTAGAAGATGSGPRTHTQHDYEELYAKAASIENATNADLRNQASKKPEPKKAEKRAVFDRLREFANHADESTRNAYRNARKTYEKEDGSIDYGKAGTAVGVVAGGIGATYFVAKRLKKILRTVLGRNQPNRRPLTIEEILQRKEYQRRYQILYRKKIKFGLHSNRRLGLKPNGQFDEHTMQAAQPHVEQMRHSIYPEGGTLKKGLARGIARVMASGLVIHKLISPVVPVLVELGRLIAKDKGYKESHVDYVAGIISIADLFGKGAEVVLANKLKKALGPEGLEILGDEYSPADITHLLIHSSVGVYQAYRAANSYYKEKYPKDPKVDPDGPSLYMGDAAQRTRPKKKKKKEDETTEAVQESSKNKLWTVAEKMELIFARLEQIPSKSMQWYKAILRRGITQAKGDIPLAIKMADSIFATHPIQPDTDFVQPLLQENFTGVLTDKIGRKEYFRNGKRVAGPQQQKPTDTSKVEVGTIHDDSKVNSVLGDVPEKVKRAYQKSLSIANKVVAIIGVSSTALAATWMLFLIGVKKGWLRDKKDLEIANTRFGRVSMIFAVKIISIAEKLKEYLKWNKQGLKAVVRDAFASDEEKQKRSEEIQQMLAQAFWPSDYEYKSPEHKEKWTGSSKHPGAMNIKDHILGWIYFSKKASKESWKLFKKAALLVDQKLKDAYWNGEMKEGKEDKPFVSKKDAIRLVVYHSKLSDNPKKQEEFEFLLVCALDRLHDFSKALQLAIILCQSEK